VTGRFAAFTSIPYQPITRSTGYCREAAMGFGHQEEKNRKTGKSPFCKGGKIKAGKAIRTAVYESSTARFQRYLPEARLSLLETEPNHRIEGHLSRQHFLLMQGHVTETSNKHLFECDLLDRVSAVPKGFLEL
jgi:hypothetical protein